MSEDRAKEIIAEKVAKEVVESIGEDLAGALVEYANLVKDLTGKGDAWGTITIKDDTGETREYYWKEKEKE